MVPHSAKHKNPTRWPCRRDIVTSLPDRNNFITINVAPPSQYRIPQQIELHIAPHGGRSDPFTTASLRQPQHTAFRSQPPHTGLPTSGSTYQDDRIDTTRNRFRQNTHAPFDGSSQYSPTVIMEIEHATPQIAHNAIRRQRPTLAKHARRKEKTLVNPDDLRAMDTMRRTKDDSTAFPRKSPHICAGADYRVSVGSAECKPN